ncbi:MAG: hypothetical protein E6K65_11490 [Nitrospirae bacterium]|jgi:hypothetical protein|nr:MAG: hypothetical protein E6K65_11490 [Nitrospirota bacterium]
MNERHVVGNGLLKFPIAPETHHMKKWSRSVAIVLIVTFMGLTMIPPGSTLAENQSSSTDSSDGTGIQVASWLLTVPYCAGKSAFAIAGSVVGGLGYAFSGGNSETAQSIWTKTVYGTYILRPAHLRGEEPIQFLGKADGDQNEPMKRAAVTSEPSKK